MQFRKTALLTTRRNSSWRPDGWCRAAQSVCDTHLWPIFTIGLHCFGQDALFLQGVKCVHLQVPGTRVVPLFCTPSPILAAWLECYGGSLTGNGRNCSQNSPVLLHPLCYAAPKKTEDPLWAGQASARITIEISKSLRGPRSISTRQPPVWGPLHDRQGHWAATSLQIS